MVGRLVKPFRLDAAHEARLIEAWRSRADLAALDQLVCAFTPLCLTWARRYATRPDEIDDLLQEAKIGLIRAIGKFDPALGYRLSTYARFWIQQYVEQAKEIGDAGVRIPTFTRRKLKRRPWEPGLHRSTGGLRELAESGATDFTSVSIDTPANDPDGAAPSAVLCDDPDPEATIIQGLDTRRRRDAVLSALSTLDPRRRRIIEARYLSDDPKTLQRLGNELSLTRERVRQLEADALARLREALQSYPIR